MADLRISQLNALNGVDLAAADLLVAVDDSASETKKLTVGDLISNGVTLIADDTIPGAKILFAAGGIATADLADSAVNTVKLADNSVTAAKLADESTVDLVTTLPASGDFVGQLALDTDDNFLYVWDGSAWVSLKAAGSINTVSGDTSGTINITTSTSGSTVTVSATIDDTAVANQFLAGPTGAGGTVAYRVIDSTDLPTSSTTAKGAVLVNGEGLRMDGDTIEVDNDVTDSTTHHVVTYSAKGLITGGRAITSADLPLATSTDAGAVIPGDGLAVDVNGNLSIDNTVAAGTYTKVTVTAEGVVSTGDTLGADDIPDHSAAKLTSGTIGSSLIASGAVTATKLADESITQFGGAVGSDNVTVFPDGNFKGQFFYDETTQDLYIYTGSAFVPITVLSGNLVNAGAYNASTNLMSSVTTAGSSAGFSVGSALPAPAGVNLNHYVVVDTSGTGSGAAPAVALAPPDMLLSQGVGTEYSLIDVSNAIAGQTASNISLIATGDIVATDVQAGIQELDTEKLPKAGGTMTGDLTLNNVNVVFEGSTADDYETTLTVTDPTADRTITLPNVTGTVVTTGDTGSVTSTMITDGTIVNADINASAEIAVSKLANGTARQLLQTDAAGTGVEFTSNVDVPGTLDVTGAATLDSTASVAGLLSANGKISFTAGTAALPAIYSGSDTNTGIYSPGADQFGISTAGSARFYIAANGNVGIGTSNPGSILDIASNQNTALRITDSNNGTYSEILYNDNGSNTSALVIGVDPDNTSTGPSDIRFSVDGSEKMRIASSGNVGIGTSSPESRLHLRADGNELKSLLNLQNRNGGSNAGSQIAFLNGGVDASDNRLAYIRSFLSGANGNFLTFGTNADGSEPQERMRIASSGNVGIGTNSPSSLLHLYSTTAAGGILIEDSNGASGSPELEIIGKRSDGNTSPAFSGKLCLSGNRLDGAVNNGKNIGTVLFGGNHTNGNTSNILYSASIGGISEGTFSNSSTMPTGLAFYTGVTGRTSDTANVKFGAERLRISSNGNVGIGTTSPGSLLHVSNGNDAASGEFIGLTIGGTDVNNARTGSLIKDTTTFDLIYKNNNFSSSVGSHIFKNGNSEHMRIASSGKVGIGTDNPIAALQVQSPNSDAIRLDRGVTNATAYLTINSNRTTSNSFIGGLNFEWNRNVVAGIKAKSGSDLTNKDNGEIVFETASAGTPVERMRILSTGGLTFNGDTAEANALDDYEEGTWTPSYRGSSSNPTISYGTQSGRYVKIGKLVTAIGRLVTNSVSGGSGNLQITGLPFTTENNANVRGVLTIGQANSWNTRPTEGMAIPNSAAIALNVGSSGGSSGVSVGDLGTSSNNNNLYFSITYRVN